MSECFGWKIEDVGSRDRRGGSRKELYCPGKDSLFGAPALDVTGLSNSSTLSSSNLRGKHTTAQAHTVSRVIKEHIKEENEIALK